MAKDTLRLGSEVKYSDYIASALVEMGFTHCFFVAGGNVMHLVESLSSKMTMVPVVHEVTAVIATEYFTAISSTGKAFALVTAGPGATNAVTGVAGAWLESRECLIIGGQVKVSDRASGGLRQRGIQEVDGIRLLDDLCVASRRMSEPMCALNLEHIIASGSSGRKGPVFLEIPLDVQAAMVHPERDWMDGSSETARSYDHAEPADASSLTVLGHADVATSLDALTLLLRQAKRPVLLLGGGLDHRESVTLWDQLVSLGMPIMTTWNGADRFSSDHEMWFGRPDTWGMRASNRILQSADLLLAVGCRLSLQQTGFNWQAFMPRGQVVHVDLDDAELLKPHPEKALRVRCEAAEFLRILVEHQPEDVSAWTAWVAVCRKVWEAIGPERETNSIHDGFVQPQKFVNQLSQMCRSSDTIIPCSSGGAFTSMMQGFMNISGQRMLTNKALASMGYGLAGAIGACLGSSGQRTILVEGDGGFAQNLQDLGTVVAQGLNLKIFVLANEGYASIRMTQMNYFNGNIVGCDRHSGLGLPNWELLGAAYGVKTRVLDDSFGSNAEFLELWENEQPALFVVPVHPEQTYYPKIGSRVLANGGMESSPLDRMLPDLGAVEEKLISELLGDR